MNKKELYPKVFTWLFVGLLITFMTGYSLSLNEQLTYNILSGSTYIILVVVEFVVAIFFSMRLAKMSKITATICYIIYSFLTGLTFSSIFLVFKLSSIMLVFLVTSITFGIFAIIGYTTKKDITSWSNYLLMALLAVIIATIINIFFKSPMFDLIITIISIIIFLAYVVYDIKRAEFLTSYNEEAGPIYAAFQLYLDFINLFVDLLRLLNNNSDN